MLVSQGEARQLSADQRLAWSLALIAGAVNGAGFYAAGFYSSHMTGTVSILADRLAGGLWLAAGVSLGIIASFILGAALSAVLIAVGERRRLAGIYALSVLAEAVLLAGLAAVDLWSPDLHRGPLLALGLSALMGLQNAIVTRLSNARIRTTHVTGMITDIGIDLGALIFRLVVRDGPPANLARLRLNGVTVGCFLTGGLLGVWGYGRWGSPVFLLVALVLAAIALPGLLRTRRRAAGAE